MAQVGGAGTFEVPQASQRGEERGLNELTQSARGRAHQNSRPEHIVMPEPDFEMPSQSQESSSVTNEEAAMRAQDAESVIGVSIGREQTRLNSPSTPAVEKSAALDRMNSWGFFYDGTEAEQEEVLRNTLQNSMPPEPQGPESDEDLSLDEADEAPSSQQSQQLSSDPRKKEFPLPSPWTAGPKAFFSDSKQPDRSRSGRSRANSAFPLGDGTIKKFLSSFTFPTISEPKALREFRGGSTNQGQEGTTRHGRSVSLLSAIPWAVNQSTQLSRSRSRSRIRDAPSGITTRDISAPLTTQQPISRDPSACNASTGLGQKAPQQPRLRHSTSDQSLVRSSLSRASTLDDMQNFDHINTMANTRMKAIRDSIQDSLPAMPSINFNALRSSYSFRNLVDGDGHGPTAMGSVFGMGGASGRSRTVSTTSTASPQRITRPRYPILQDALDNLTGDIVIMGGYRGSVLRSAEPGHRQLWVPIKVGLNMRKANLEVGLNPEDEENMHQQIWPSGMLTHIGPVDISQRLLKKLRNCRNAKTGKLRVHDYGYDWRLSPHLLSRKLISFLQSLKCNQSGVPDSERGATVIAHSLGGLITRHAANHNPELFAGIVYAGVPQHCVNILGPLRNGDEVLLSSKVLTAQVNFSFRTSFLLLPDNGQCFLNKETNEQYHINFHDVNTWSQYALSPCIAPCLPALSQPERRTILGTISSTLPGNRSIPAPTLSKAESSPERSVEATAETKAEDMIHPAQQTLKPSMGSPPPPSNVSTISTIPVPVAKEYLKRTLADILQFRKELAHKPSLQSSNSYPPLSLIYSTATPTVYGARVASREAIRHADAYDNLAFASGDGVVLARAAMVPRGYKVAEGGRVRTERGHVGMLGDLEAVGKCLLAVNNARKEGVGLGGVTIVDNKNEERQGPDILATQVEGHEADGQGNGAFF